MTVKPLEIDSIALLVQPEQTYPRQKPGTDSINGRIEGTAALDIYPTICSGLGTDGFELKPLLSNEIAFIKFPLTLCPMQGNLCRIISFMWGIVILCSAIRNGLNSLNMLQYG